jgi:hypothetical protein
MSIRSKHIELAALMATVAALIATPSAVWAQDQQELTDKIKALEQRLNELEGKTAQQTNYVAKTDIASKTLAFLGKSEFSGYVSSSFFYAHGDGAPVNLGFITQNSEFMINKVKLALEKPIVTSGDKWDAGYAVGMIFGQDAQVLGATGLSLCDYGVVENATISANIPVGNGLAVKVGKMVTMLGVEVIEETVNPNWTVGNQFQWVEPYTTTGVQLGYKFNDKVDAQFMVFNGWDALPDNNGNVSYMARVGFTFSEATQLALLGYGGCEQSGGNTNNPNYNNNWRYGVEAILTQKLCDKLTAYLQLDYGHEDNAFTPDGTQTANSAWYASGLWLVYQACDKAALAFRVDYLRDVDSTRTASLFGGPVTNPGNNNMTSFTGTINWTPWKGLQIRPEVRYDMSSEEVFNGHKGQVSVGLGTAYVF